ncbi:MAG: enoyl-CoA hydratase/isomerase family protein [Acidimicrobiales bacterium]
MSDGSIRSERAGARLTLVIDRPHKRNALSRHLQDELAAALDAHAGDETIGVVVITAAGTDNFVSGGDLVALAEVRSAEGAREIAVHGRGVLDRVRRFPVPVVAALNGDALGGGAELALACDFRVAAVGARIAFAQGRQAITSAWGGGADLMTVVGPSMALRLLCTTEAVAHDLGLRVGLYDLVAAPSESLDRALDGFLAPMLRQAPHVLRSYKSLAVARRMDDRRSVLEAVELDDFVRNWVHEDHWSALAAFLSRDRE